MKSKLKLLIFFIMGVVISVTLSTYTFVKIKEEKQIKYQDKKELKSTSDPDYISGVYSSSNTLNNVINNLVNTTSYKSIEKTTAMTSFSESFTVSKTGYYLFTFNVRMYGWSSANNYYHISLSSGGDPLGGAAVPADYRFTTATFIYKMTSTSVTLVFSTANNTKWSVRGYWTYLGPA